MASVYPFEDLGVECLIITMSNDNPWNGPYPTPIPSEFIRFFYEPCSDYPPNDAGFTIELAPQSTSSFIAYAYNFFYDNDWSTNFTITTQSFEASRPLSFNTTSSVSGRPQVSQTQLPISFKSNETGSTDFKYLMDVYISGSNDRLTRIKTKPNPEGIGVFNPATIYDSYLEYNYYWTSSIFDSVGPHELLNDTNFYKDFELKFGTEYIPDGEKQVVVFNGYGQEGDPDYSGPYLTSSLPPPYFQPVFKGTVNPLDHDEFEFNRPDELFNKNPYNPLLSNRKIGTRFLYPESKKFINTNDFETITFFQDLGAASVIKITVIVKLVNGDNITEEIMNNMSSDDGRNMYITGVGPQNLSSGSAVLEEAFNGYGSGSIGWDYYDLQFYIAQPGSDDPNVRYRYYNNDTDTTYSIINSWSAGAVVPNTKYLGAAGGTRNDTLYTNGFDGGTSPSTILGKTFAYNGSSWSTKQTNPFPVQDGGGAGNTSAFIAFGGDNNLGSRQRRTTYFNGSSWSVVNSLQNGLESMAYAGDANDALAIGGDPATESDETQFWNGTTWNYGAQLVNDHDDRPAAFGNSSKAVVVGDAHTEEYNGTAWSTISFPPGIPSLRNSGGSGTGNTGIIANGRQGASSIVKEASTYDGITWTTLPLSIYGVEFNDVTGDSNSANSLGGATLGPGARDFNQEWDVINTKPNITGEANNFNYDPVRFVWVNPYGVWEYYSIMSPITKNTDIKSKDTSISRVKYDSNTSPYNINARSKKRINTNFTDNFSITTDYLNDNEADFISEMIESPQVFIQEGRDFIPIVISNSTYKSKTNIRGQKIFQYLINFHYSNQRLNIS